MTSWTAVEKNSAMAQHRDWRFGAVMGTLMIMNLMAALEASSLAVALPIVTDTLHASSIQGFWSGTSFLLASTIFQPLFSSYSHVFDRKPLLLVALVLFATGSLVAGCAHNFNVLLVGRCLQGVGGGGIIALTSVILTDLLPLRQRGKWSGLISAMWALGSVIGPPIGGALAQKASWRWIFWINLPLCVIAFPIAWVSLSNKPNSGPVMVKLRSIDWVGCILFLVSSTGFLVPLSWGGIMFPWNTIETLIPLCFGAVGLIAFGLYEKFVPSEPLIRLTVFSTTTAAVSYIGTTIQGLASWCVVFYLPLYYEGVKFLSPTATGIAFFPFSFTIAPVSIVTAILIGRIGRYNWSLWGGWATTTLGLGLFQLLTVHTSTVSWVFLSLVTGIGVGMIYPACFFAIQAGSLRTEDLPFSAAMSGFLRTFGQALGVSIGGVIFQNRFKHELLGYPELASHAEEYSRDVSSLVENVRTMNAGSPMRIILVQCLSDALRTVWVVMCCLSGFALLSSLLSTDLSLDRDAVVAEHKLHGGGGGESMDDDTRQADTEMQKANKNVSQSNLLPGKVNAIGGSQPESDLEDDGRQVSDGDAET